MRRRKPFIRNLHGRPEPWILTGPFYCVARLDMRVRKWWCRRRGEPYRLPCYLYSYRTPEQEADVLLGCEAFLGGHSPEPRLQRFYSELVRWRLLSNPDVGKNHKRGLLAEGARCTDDDIAHALGPATTPDGWEEWEPEKKQMRRDALLKALNGSRDASQRVLGHSAGLPTAAFVGECCDAREAHDGSLRHAAR